MGGCCVGGCCVGGCCVGGCCVGGYFKKGCCEEDVVWDVLNWWCCIWLYKCILLVVPYEEEGRNFWRGGV